jgi:hypothetical protein
MSDSAVSRNTPPLKWFVITLLPYESGDVQEFDTLKEARIEFDTLKEARIEYNRESAHGYADVWLIEGRNIE